MLGPRQLLVIVLSVGMAACRAPGPRGGSAGDAGEARVVPNDNRESAGSLRNGILTLHLEVREARWFPDGDDGPSEVVQVFAEAGGAPRNPGPLIRVPAGTELRVSVRNPLHDSTLIIYGLHIRPGTASDTIQVAPGGVREVAFTAGEPGTYFYWGTTTHAPLGKRDGIDSQLHGAFIIDPAESGPPRDRIFVLGQWTALPDTSAPPPHFARDIRVINGLSWPHTERFTYTVGDTVRWRWVNPTASAHPLHLHGIYFDVMSRGTWAADTQYATGAERHVVTELPTPGETFTMAWAPEEPGNWLMHCHIAFHVSHFLSFATVPDPEDPLAPDAVDHSVHGMRGMILGITVKPGRSTARRQAHVAGARELRLVAQSAPGRYGKYDGLAFVLHGGTREPAVDSVPVPSAPLVLRRGEPVRITIVNRLRAPTAVHWHGMELPSYSDGVPGWSGMGVQLAPAIAPGDSFVAAFTPPRAGTFMYHAHSNEFYQISLGLYGALLVVDPDRYDPARERLVIIGANGPDGNPRVRVNGRTTPDTVRMTAGETYRLRLMQIYSDGSTRITLRKGAHTEEWRALAKDGAELPESQRVTGPATLLAGPGETADFAFTPAAPGALSLEVRERQGEWTVLVPIRVERARTDPTASVHVAQSRSRSAELVPLDRRIMADTAQLRAAAQEVVNSFRARIAVTGVDVGPAPWPR